MKKTLIAALVAASFLVAGSALADPGDNGTASTSIGVSATITGACSLALDGDGALGYVNPLTGYNHPGGNFPDLSEDGSDYAGTDVQVRISCNTDMPYSLVIQPVNTSHKVLDYDFGAAYGIYDYYMRDGSGNIGPAYSLSISDETGFRGIEDPITGTTATGDGVIGFGSWDHNWVPAAGGSYAAVDIGVSYPRSPNINHTITQGSWAAPGDYSAAVNVILSY